MNLNFRGLDPTIAAMIHTHRIEHGHPNLTATLECIIKQWSEQRDYVEEHDGSGRVSSHDALYSQAGVQLKWMRETVASV